MSNDDAGQSVRSPIVGETSRRFALTLHYRGDAFHGWQLQPDVPTVQGAVESVLRRVTGSRRPVIGSGRTDSGVHATGQVAAVTVPAQWNSATLRKALNALLPRSMWVSRVRRVALDFHPRFHARRRSYEYVVGTAEHAHSPFRRDTCWPLDDALDREILVQSASVIPGERSFLRFAKAGQPERGDRCRVMQSEWRSASGFGHVFRITADRYLHRMVRYLVGTMVEIGIGRRPLSDMLELLEEPDTSLRTSPPAPSSGLFLTAVEYPLDSWNAYDDRDPTSATEPTSSPLDLLDMTEATNVNAPKGPRR